MIETVNLCKSFGDITAVNDVSVTMKDAEVFGLVGTNGAGKSTMLRMLSGVMRQTCGELRVDGEPVYDNVKVKRDIFFIPNDFYYFPNSCGAEMAAYFAALYPDFSYGEFERLMKNLDLDMKRRISTFSKGMKKQLSLILGLCSHTKYLLCDETFDGLDPVMRRTVSGLIAGAMADRGLTPVLTSHNLREIEDLCDHIGFLHKGGILLSKDLDDAKAGYRKVQCVFESGETTDTIFKSPALVGAANQGRLWTLTLRGGEEDISALFAGINMVYFEILPLSLEEIFVSEIKAAGYDGKITIC